MSSTFLRAAFFGAVRRFKQSQFSARRSPRLQIRSYRASRPFAFILFAAGLDDARIDCDMLREHRMKQRAEAESREREFRLQNGAQDIRGQHAGEEVRSGVGPRGEQFSDHYGGQHANRDAKDNRGPGMVPSAAVARREQFTGAYGGAHDGWDGRSGLGPDMVPRAAAARGEQFADVYGGQHAGRDVKESGGRGMVPTYTPAIRTYIPIPVQVQPQPQPMAQRSVAPAAGRSPTVAPPPNENMAALLHAMGPEKLRSIQEAAGSPRGRPRGPVGAVAQPNDAQAAGGAGAAELAAARVEIAYLRAELERLTNRVARLERPF